MTDNGYSVHVEARCRDRLFDQMLDESCDRLADMLARHHGTVTCGPRSWTAQFTVDADGPARALTYAVDLVCDLARDVGLPNWPLVRVEAIREDVLAEDVERPTLPDLVSGPEAAEILGVSPQRLHQLADEHPDFPHPVYRLRAGKIWLRAAIERFAQTWERRPGRPRKQHAAA